MATAAKYTINTWNMTKTLRLNNFTLNKFAAKMHKSQKKKVNSNNYAKFIFTVNFSSEITICFSYDVVLVFETLNA